MKTYGYSKSILTLMIAGAGLAMLFAGHGTNAVEQAPRPAPHAPLTSLQREARAAYWASKRGLQFGIPDHAYEQAIANARRIQAAAPLGLGGSPLIWNFIGPSPMLNNYPNFGGWFTGPPLNTSEGRVAAVAADPRTADLVYVGAAGGGVWRSTDGGGTFTAIFNGEPTQAIGAITVDSTGTVWVGTGEGVHSDSYYGQGIFKSTDHGDTWSQITGGAGSPFTHAAFRRIAVDNNVPPRIFAPTTYASSLSRADAIFRESEVNNDGLWRSTDGGLSWIQVGNSTLPGGRATFNDCSQFTMTDPCPGTDVVIDLNNPNRVYAAIDFVNVFISTDGGTDWSEANFPGVKTGTVNEIGRASLAVTSSGTGKPATVYAALGHSGGQFYRGFFSSTDSGVTWSAQTIPSVLLGTGAGAVTLDGDGTGVSAYSQSSYDQTITVEPANPQTVYFGGVGPYLSTDGGATWSFIAGSTDNTTVQETHTDQQTSALDPFNPNKLYLGNDGGFYAYDLATGSWTTFFDNNQNATIDSGQIQGIGPHPTDNSRLLAGFQDNGTQLFSGTLGWNTVETGDGGFALFDSANPDFAYHTFATTGSGPQPSRSTDGGLTWNSNDPSTSLQSVIGMDTFSFYPPVAADPSSGSRVMIGGHSIYVSTDGMLTWQVQSNNLTAGACPIDNDRCALQDIEFVPNTTMAWALSMQDGKIGFALSNTDNADANSGVIWNNVTANLPFASNQTQATGIAFDPNPGRTDVAYLSISGFTAATGVGHIYQTTNFGKNWNRVDGAGGASPLPDVPTLRILVDNTDATGKTLLAGTDIGVFRSTDEGATSAYNLGVIPAVPVFDLEQNKNGLIFAGTHGRGAYRLGSGSPTPTPTETGSPAPTPTPVSSPGATASSSPVTVSALPGASVAAGSVVVTNTAGVAETVGALQVTATTPGVFASLTMSGAGQSVTVTSPATATTFSFTPISLPAGGSLTFSLNATIATNLAAKDTGVEYAGLMTGGSRRAVSSALPMAAGFLLMSLMVAGMPASRRRRIMLGAILAVALAATELGCGGGSSHPTIFSSSQSVTAITASYASGGAVKVGGLPAQLSTINVF